MPVQELLKKAEIIGSYSNSFVAADLDRMREAHDLVDKRAATSNKQHGSQRKNITDHVALKASGLSANNMIDLSKVVTQYSSSLKTASITEQLNQAK